MSGVPVRRLSQITAQTTRSSSISSRPRLVSSSLTSPSPSSRRQSLSFSPASGLSSRGVNTLPCNSSSSSSSTSSAAATMGAGRLHEPILLVCDIQEKFAKAIYEFDAIVATTSKLLDASDVLGFPVASSTQSQAKLGVTVPALRLDQRHNFKLNYDKTLFSMYNRANPELMQLLSAPANGRPRDVLLVGIETHICVTQTSLDLLAAGHRVYIVSDGVSSCNREEKPIALARLAREGAIVTTSESVLYEIMGDAAIPQFRDIAKLVKETKDATRNSLRALNW